ncbi:Ycf66 family protein [Leptolyngbya sp. KIOST-1]|uniref:Ycf66 family protein n=1 Tax=Leptolyngbya sp. KIOST-1 TaxID=1229172 RepID=UPI000691BF84|nr:Ycf66 family protein [Leptolyngbya sp. KIOST-1]
MWVQVLAIAVWLGSLALYGAAFFFPEVHRRHDFFWSGVGAFYGLVLWFSAVQTSPTELLGHLASVVLLGWLGWQTLTLRRKRTPLDLQTPLTADAWPAFGRQLKQSVLNGLRTTPLGRWLPTPEPERSPGDPAIAVSEIRVSSLKDVDYEFVDELTPSDRRATPATGSPGTEPAVVAAVPPVRAPRSPRPSAPPGSAQPKATPPSPRQKPTTLAARLAGLKAWLGDVVKARQTPKPKRAVIDIPPRPSPLAKKKVAQATPSPQSPPEPAPDLPLGVTIIDTEAIDPEAIERRDRGEEADSPATPSGSEATPTASSEAQADSDPAPPPVSDETNWADDTNWADLD